MPQLDIKEISRRFGAVQALDSVSLQLSSGEVHAVMGENGAGKSTLIRILAGLDRPDTGTLQLDGAALPAGNPLVMRAAGLRFIHQELHIVPGLSVAENMHLTHPYPRRLGLVNWRALHKAAGKALSRLDLDRIDPRGPISALGAGDQMLVRIASSLIQDAGRPAWLYVMDEPTAALTTEEADRLFRVIDELLRQGAGVLYVSHRMQEVLSLADRISVLRDGAVVSSRSATETTQARVIEEMTGRDLSQLFPQRSKNGSRARVVLKVTGLQGGRLNSADFELRAGEILGIAGLAGSGRGDLLKVLMGDTARRSGEVVLDGATLNGGSSQAWAHGFAYVPRERRTEGLMLRRAITENITLPHLSKLARAMLFLNHARQRRVANKLGERVRLKADNVGQACEELSGGNQQKVLFARAIAGTPRVLLLDEPTRGVDIGARYDLYRLIRGFSEQGMAVIIASSDLPELIGLADRIGIMQNGRLIEFVDTEDCSESNLLSRFYRIGQKDIAG